MLLSHFLDSRHRRSSKIRQFACSLSRPSAVNGCESDSRMHSDLPLFQSVQPTLRLSHRVPRLSRNPIARSHLAAEHLSAFRVKLQC